MVAAATGRDPVAAACQVYKGRSTSERGMDEEGTCTRMGLELQKVLVVADKPANA